LDWRGKLPVPPDPTLGVAATDDQEVFCQVCGDIVAIEDVPALSRKKPNEIFAAWCLPCWKRLINAAARAMAADEFVDALLN
jgi:hypothetical protein